jgi:DNA-binding response OmpR family regulator
MVVADYLRECGYAVIEGVSADDARKVFQSGRQIDFVLTEVTLPGDSDGFALAKWIRDNYDNVDVVLTSGVQRSADKASDLCDDGPLQKPYEPQEIVRRINLLLERRRQANSKP